MTNTRMPSPNNPYQPSSLTQEQNLLLNQYLQLDPSADLRLGHIFLINKPLGWTSANAVSKCRHLLNHVLGYKRIRVGHAGTLDPLATGLLTLCIGRATRLAATLQELNKTYEAEITIGASTPSYDLETQPQDHKPYKHITQSLFEQTLKSFLGEQLQTPPAFSAKRIDGTRAYKLARKGQVAEVKPAPITIYQIQLLAFDPPRITLSVTCSKGTYIRSLAHDLGQKLGTGAHLTALCRTSIGPLSLGNALSIKDLEQLLNTIKETPQRFIPEETTR